MIEKKKVHIEQTKSNVAFTHSPNKCHNIFTKHLFSIVVGHSFIFYYFILTYKKLTPQKLWKYYEICCISIIIGIKEKEKDKKKKKKKKTKCLTKFPS